MADEQIAKMLLNLCSKLSQRIDLYHLSTGKDHDFFLTISSPHRTTDVIL